MAEPARVTSPARAPIELLCDERTAPRLARVAVRRSLFRGTGLFLLCMGAALAAIGSFIFDPRRRDPRRPRGPGGAGAGRAAIRRPVLPTDGPARPRARDSIRRRHAVLHDCHRQHRSRARLGRPLRAPRRLHAHQDAARSAMGTAAHAAADRRRRRRSSWGTRRRQAAAATPARRATAAPRGLPTSRHPAPHRACGPGPAAAARGEPGEQPRAPVRSRQPRLAQPRWPLPDGLPGARPRIRRSRARPGDPRRCSPWWWPSSRWPWRGPPLQCDASDLSGT